MDKELGIRGHLEGNQEIPAGKGALEGVEDVAFPAGTGAAAPEAPEPVQALPDVEGAVVFVAGEEGAEGVACRVIKDGPEGAVAEGASDGQGLWARGLGTVEVVERRLGKAGVGVDPVFFEGDVVGADIALLKDADGDVEFAGNGLSGEVDGPAVPEEENEVDVLFAEEGLQKGGPLTRGAPEQGAVPREKHPVPAVKVDFADLRTGPGQILGEPAKKGANGALEQRYFFALKFGESAGDHETYSAVRRIYDTVCLRTIQESWNEKRACFGARRRGSRGRLPPPSVGVTGGGCRLRKLKEHRPPTGARRGSVACGGAGGGLR